MLLAILYLSLGVKRSVKVLQRADLAVDKASHIGDSWRPSGSHINYCPSSELIAIKMEMSLLYRQILSSISW